MKNIMMITLISLLGIFAQAQEGGHFGWGRGGWGRPGPVRPGPGPGFPGRPGPGRPGPGFPGGPGQAIQCVASDNGWEEHRGGHSSCGQCLQIHGQCTETCSRSYSVCQAEGLDRSGHRFVSEGRAESRFQAEDEAMRACYYYRYQNCRVTNCNQNNETVSRRECSRR